MDEYNLKDFPAFVSSRFEGVLQRHGHTTTLNLTNLGLTDRQVKKIVESIDGGGWTKLWLNYNKLGNQGVSQILQAFEQNNQQHALREICLANNNIGDNTVIRIAVLFKEICPLSVLDLANNKSIADESMTELAMMVRRAPSLKKLCLSGIGVSDQGVRHLLECIKNSSLRELRLSSDRISDATIDAMIETVKQSCLTVVTVPNAEQISTQKLEELTRILEWKSSNIVRVLTTLCAVSLLPRLSSQSSLRLFPKELYLKLAKALSSVQNH